ncbi:hypothetical protein JKA74_09400 [Marivirga sp. S37H4]|uniref:Uncharacterized protein n=1 Tax=Marivirga aurantiaca TaxID=2802615 RepID=A0A935C842_9BACT|nr:hypothetical protein [Marivirga aurantiaca]MBK6265254.1 hypothetical protein [Marivirga aurantiaca]
MYTHADKAQDNKSQSVSASSFQIQSGSESTFQFVDNRPEAIAQRKLQEMVNNSPKAIQFKAFQDMANNNPEVVQLKKLANDKLNVVGENHDESKERRDLEISFSKSKTGGEYWEEHDFKPEQGKFGDNPFLLLLGTSSNTLGNFEPAFIIFNNEIKNKGEQQAVSKFIEDGVILLEKSLVLMKDHSLKFYPILSGEEKISIGHAYLKTKTIMIPFAKELKNRLKHFADNSDTTEEEKQRGLQDISRISRFIIQQLKTISENLSFDEVAEKRSDHMNQIANTYKHLKGVWKVGQKHVDDINKKDDITPDYSLISQNEFNAEYKEWLEENQENGVGGT